MKSATTPDGVRRITRDWRKEGRRIGFVPTMGALHLGHRSLLERARRECDRVVVSIFVNPLQFGPAEDLTRYPRPLARDRKILREEKTDLLYLPRRDRLYPADFRTRVGVSHLGELLEGKHRPGHFEGVTTIVAKLLLAVEPDRLYLGQKDAQQAIILTRMARDLDFGVRVVVCATVRESDGLAFSSRNAYLSAEDRAWAPKIYRSLTEAAGQLRSGALRRPKDAAALVRRRLSRGPGRLEYAVAVHAETLEEPSTGDPILLAVAYDLGKTRLIDNIHLRRWGRS